MQLPAMNKLASEMTAVRNDCKFLTVTYSKNVFVTGKIIAFKN